MTATFRSILVVFAWGCALLAAVQLPGAALDYVVRQDIGPPAIIALVLIGAAALILRRRTDRTRPSGVRALGAAAVAFGLAAVLAQLAPLVLTQRVVEVSDMGILVPAPGRSTECRGRPRRCHELLLNELGLRGRLVTRPVRDARLVAFVGDSYIFGSGVGEDDTVPAVVARMLSDLEPRVAVVNAGIPGLNGGSFPGVIRYVRARLDPDLVVVLLKDDDLDATDKFTRWGQFRSSFWFRMSSVTNFEPMYETARQLGRRWFGRRDQGGSLRDHLDRIAAATAGARLLVIAALAESLQPAFDEWMAAHPDVVWVTAWEDPRYWAAEQIPHDGHWTEAGCQAIAEMVAPLIRGQLSTSPASAPVIGREFAGLAPGSGAARSPAP